MSAPRAKPPIAGPHPQRPQRASAVVVVATVASPRLVAATRAVRDFLILRHLAVTSRGNVSGAQLFHKASCRLVIMGTTGPEQRYLSTLRQPSKISQSGVLI